MLPLTLTLFEILLSLILIVFLKSLLSGFVFSPKSLTNLEFPLLILHFPIYEMHLVSHGGVMKPIVPQ